MGHGRARTARPCPATGLDCLLRSHPQRGEPARVRVGQLAPTWIRSPSATNFLSAAFQAVVWNALMPVSEVGVLTQRMPLRSIGEAYDWSRAASITPTRLRPAGDAAACFSVLIRRSAWTQPATAIVLFLLAVVTWDR